VQGWISGFSTALTASLRKQPPIALSNVVTSLPPSRLQQWARYRIELSTIVELFVDAENIESAREVAQAFIAQHADRGQPKYKLHAIYDTEREAPSDPLPSDAVEQGVAA
jgi:hypothetical protein